MRAFAPVLLLTVLLLAGCSGGGGGSGMQVHDPELHEIAMHNQVYEPSTITVVKGDILRFTSHDVSHSARTMDGAYNTGEIKQGQSADLHMDTAGTVALQCQFHAGMRLTVTVTA